MIKRVGFTGAGATGKTTTANLISPWLGMPLVPGVARGVLVERGIDERTQLHMSNTDKWELQRAMFNAKITQDAKQMPGIYDRTLLDHTVYCFYWCNAKIEENMAKSLLAMAKENFVTYDKVFFFPMYDWERLEDETRIATYAYRIAIDAIFKGLINTLGLNVTIVPDGTIQERGEFIMDQLG